MPKLLEIYCVYFCVQAVNNYITDGSIDNSSPRQRFLGRKTDAKHDLRFIFGSYCHVTAPNTNNSMKSRSEPCICLLSAGNLTGSVRMFSLQTQAVITRDNFNLLPIPTSVVEFISKLALAKGRKPTARFALQHQIDPSASASLSDLMLVDTSQPPAPVDILGAARLGTPAIEVGAVPALEGRVREETAELPLSVPTSDQLDGDDAGIDVEVPDDNSEVARADPQEELPCKAAPGPMEMLL
jgi:hypothetical protein